MIDNSDTEVDSVDPTQEALMKWISTFAEDIGEDAFVDYFQQLRDGVILHKITSLLTRDINDKEIYEQTYLKDLQATCKNRSR